MDFFPPPLVLITSSQFLSFLIFKEPQTSRAAFGDCWQPRGAGLSEGHIPSPVEAPKLPLTGSAWPSSSRWLRAFVNSQRAPSYVPTFYF